MKMHLIILSFLLGLTGLLYSNLASSGYPGAPDIHPELTRFFEAELQANGDDQSNNGPAFDDEQNDLELIAHLPVGPFVSDVWAHGDFAYVGGIGPFPVHIVDISDPANPAEVATLSGAEPDSSPQDVKVEKVHTKYFHGDLLVVANEGGAPPTFGGIQLFDVSDPANPVLLSAPRIGPVHNAYIYQTEADGDDDDWDDDEEENRAYVLLAIRRSRVT